MAGLDQAVLVVDAQDQRQHHAHRDQAAAAVADEGQGQALGRQHAHVHRHVDHRLQADPARQAVAEVGLEQAVEALGVLADDEAAPDDDAEQRQQGDDAEQAELLSQLGCQYVQGYYYGRPVPLETFNQSLR